MKGTSIPSAAKKTDFGYSFKLIQEDYDATYLHVMLKIASMFVTLTKLSVTIQQLWQD
jgi:hypothetical protein